MVVLAAQAVLEAPAETAELVEQAGLAVVVPVQPAGLAWLPRVAMAAPVASAVLATTPRVWPMAALAAMRDLAALVVLAGRPARLA
jgi:hypothetical protein